MHYYETAHRNPGDEFATATAHNTLDEAISFADAHGITYISEIGGCWDDFEKCAFCGEWFASPDLDSEGICSDCRRAIEEHSAPEPRPGDLRLVRVGFSYEVQRWSARNEDGYYVRDWRTVRTFTNEPEAIAYMKEVQA